MSKQVLINAKQLHRYYGSYHAVNDLNLVLHKGEVLGLLGPNGAGKSTAMQMLSGNLAPGSGEITINGVDLLDSPREAKRHIGYLPEQPPVYRDMTVLEYLNFCARLNDVAVANINNAVNSAMQRCGLVDVSKRLIGNLSKGYQQRTGIAQAILHNPAVVILDEPTVGLDPIQIQEIRQLIRDLGEDHSVILSTHILPEVQAVCDRVQIIAQGRTVYSDSLEALSVQGQSSEIVLGLQLADSDDSVEQVDSTQGEDDEVEGIVQQLTALQGVEQVEVGTQVNRAFSFNITTSDESDQVNRICQLAVSQDWMITEITPKKSTLESIFLDLVHKEESVGE